MFTVLKQRKNRKGFSMGVVTYISRFEEYFKPLVKQLDAYFPNVEKNYLLNGFYDQDRQKKYLEQALSFLSSTQAHSVTYYNEHQSLAKCWNQLIIRSGPQKIVVMNDDLRIDWRYRWFLNLQLPFYQQAVINRTWSNFLISKNTVRKFGWFDERFLGVGHEDADYQLRQAFVLRKNSPRLYFHTLYCLGIKNIVAKNFDPGWKKFSKTIGDKYTQYNTDFFYQKWDRSDTAKPAYVCAFDGKYFGVKPGMETPMFYDLDVLNNPLAVLGHI